MFCFVSILTVKKKKNRAVSPDATSMVVVNKGYDPDVDKNAEYPLTSEEKLAQESVVICNPTYGESVDSGQNTAEPRQGADYEEIKEGSAAKEGHY